MHRVESNHFTHVNPPQKQNCSARFITKNRIYFKFPPTLFSFTAGILHHMNFPGKIVNYTADRGLRVMHTVYTVNEEAKWKLREGIKKSEVKVIKRLE